MSKYIDLADEIHEAGGLPFSCSVAETLRWLDEHRDKAPGRTISEGTERDLYHAAQHGPYPFRDALNDHRITVIPDPEPTNAEKLKAVYDAWISDTNDEIRIWDWFDNNGVKAGN